MEGWPILPRSGAWRTQQAVFLQFAHDDRDGLRRKAGHARYVGFGQAAVLAHERQHQPLIVVAHAALVGATVQTALGCLGRTVPRNAGLHPCSSRRFPTLLLGQNGRTRQVLSIINKSDLIIDTPRGLVSVDISVHAGKISLDAYADAGLAGI